MRTDLKAHVHVLTEYNSKKEILHVLCSGVTISHPIPPSSRRSPASPGHARREAHPRQVPGIKHWVPQVEEDSVLRPTAVLTPSALPFFTNNTKKRLVKQKSAIQSLECFLKQERFWSFR